MVCAMQNSVDLDVIMGPQRRDFLYQQIAVLPDADAAWSAADSEAKRWWNLNQEPIHISQHCEEQATDEVHGCYT